MTPSEARALIGQKVIYRAHADAPPEEGVVTSVGEWFVFVRYGSDALSKATPAHMLEAIR